MKKKKQVREYVLDLLQKSGLKGDELTKNLIIWNQFYNEVEPELRKLTKEDQKLFAGKFLTFVVQFEAICARAFRPLTGTQSTAKDIISMYSARDITPDPSHISQLSKSKRLLKS